MVIKNSVWHTVSALWEVFTVIVILLVLPLSFVTSVVVHIRIVPRFSAPENVRSEPVYSHHIPFSNQKCIEPTLCLAQDCLW